MKLDMAAVKGDLAAVKGDLAAVKGDLAAVQNNLTSLWSELGRVGDQVENMNGKVTANKRLIKAQASTLDGVQTAIDGVESKLDGMESELVGQKGDMLGNFNHTFALFNTLSSGQEMLYQNLSTELKTDDLRIQEPLNSLQQVVETQVLDQGEAIAICCNQTLVQINHLADRQETLYRYISADMSSLCPAMSNDPPTGSSATEPLTTASEPPTTASEPPTTASEPPTTATEPPTTATEPPTTATEPPTTASEPPTTATEPPTTASEPPTTASEPPTTASEPPTTATEPPTTASEPPTTASEPPTTATEPPTTASEPPTSASTATATDQGYTCGGTSGWRRAVFLNMTDPTHNCPSGWEETGYSKRTCGRASELGGTCDSATFPTGGLEYSRVCGRAVGYQFGALSAFYTSSSQNIESHYVNGLSLTHGSPGSRQHIWTFAGGIAEAGTNYPTLQCPCDGGTSPVPDFLGNDYFCESGINGPWVDHQFIFHPEDQLWDGGDCLLTRSCCSFNNPPYFIKEIGVNTNDDIEGRICSFYARSVSDLAIELLEIFVQ